MFELIKVEAKIRESLIQYLKDERHQSRVPKDGENHAARIAGIMKCLRETLEKLSGPPPQFDIVIDHHAASRTLSATVHKKGKS